MMAQTSLELARKQSSSKSAINTRFKGICSRAVFAKIKSSLFLWRKRLRTWRSSTRSFVRRNQASGRARQVLLNEDFSNDSIAQGQALFEASQILEEVSDLSFFFGSVATGEMRRDKTVGRVPKRMIGRQRFRVRDVEIRSRESPGAQLSD